MCAYIDAHLHTCTNKCTHTRTLKSTHICTHTCTHTCIYMCKHTCKHKCTLSPVDMPKNTLGVNLHICRCKFASAMTTCKFTPGV